MTDDVQIIDDFLYPNEFEKIEQCLMRNESFPWSYISHGVSNGDGFEGKYFYMIHWFFNHYQIQSQYFDLLIPLLEKLKCMALLRVKANLYPNQGSPIYTHGKHVDFSFKNKAAIFSVNTCDGGTIINNEKIDSIKNRIIIFDGSNPHASTTCTDQQTRINISFNYFTE